MTTISNQDKQWGKSCWIFIINIPDNENSKAFAVMVVKAGLDCIEKAGRQKNNFKKPIIDIPHNDNNNNRDSSHRGFAIVAFRYPEEAQFFRKNWTKHDELSRLRSQIKVYLHSEYEKLKNQHKIMKTLDKPKKIKFEQYKEDRDIYYWLKDEKGEESFRDQYIIRYKANNKHQTVAYWFNEHIPGDQSEVEYDHSLKSPTPVKWSNTGIYLATLHPRGIQLWGGPKWNSLVKLSHQRVDHVDFSPDDKYLISCNVHKPNKDNDHVLIIWNALDGSNIREFKNDKIGPLLNLLQKEKKEKKKKKGFDAWWPIFRWSGDSRFLCKVDSSKKMSTKPKDFDKLTILASNEQIINGKRLPEFSKLDKKTLKTPNLYDFKLSPEKKRKASRSWKYTTYLAYTQVSQQSLQQNSNTSGNLVVMEIPSKKILKTQTLGFDVGKADIFWNYNGDFVAVKISHIKCTKRQVKDRNDSTKQTWQKNLIINNSIGILSTQLESMPYYRIPNLPKTSVFEWDKQGNRFGILHGDLTTPDVSIYEINHINRNRNTFNIELVLRLENNKNKKKANCIKWAPYGNGLCVAWLEQENKGRDARLEFILDLYNPSKNIVRKHNGANHLEWCPSGRYLVSLCTTPLDNETGGDDTGFIVWDWQGNELYRNNLKFFYQFLWRPRPKIRLSREDKDIIRKRLLKDPVINQPNKKHVDEIKEIDENNNEENQLNYYNIFVEHDRKIKWRYADNFTKENTKNHNLWTDILRRHKEQNIEIKKERTKMRNDYIYQIYDIDLLNNNNNDDDEKTHEPQVKKQIVKEKTILDYQERVLSEITATKIIYGKEEYDIKYIDQILSKEEDEDEINNNKKNKSNGNNMQSNSNQNSIRTSTKFINSRNNNIWGNQKMFGN